MKFGEKGLQWHGRVLWDGKKVFAELQTGGARSPNIVRFTINADNAMVFGLDGDTLDERVIPVLLEASADYIADRNAIEIVVSDPLLGPKGLLEITSAFEMIARDVNHTLKGTDGHMWSGARKPYFA